MRLTDERELLMYYPLVLMLYDCHEPQLAPLVIEVVAERDTETCGLVWGIMADAVRDELNLN